MSDSMTLADCMVEIQECCRRLKFTEIELGYIIGRASTRPIDPWDSPKIAGKLGISLECLLTYQSRIADIARLQNPLLAASIVKTQDIEQRLSEAITAEGKRREALVADLANEYRPNSDYLKMPSGKYVALPKEKA